MWEKHNILVVQKDVPFFWQTEPKHYNIPGILLLFYNLTGFSQEVLFCK